MIPIAAADPLETLADLGLQPIQARENQRQVRDLIPQAGPLRAVAELVIDSVTYRFGDTVVRHLEVEIESKLPGDNSALEVASRRLLADYAPELRVWPYGKLTTGASVQELLEQGSLARHIGPGGYLLPGAYTAIEQLLGRR
jgi:hypothetical protein